MTPSRASAGATSSTSRWAWLRTPVGAAFLSFVFPGLGQFATGRRVRGAIVATPAVLTTLGFVLLLVFDRRSLFDIALNAEWLSGLLVLDLVLLVYHCAAILDAYLVAIPERRLQVRRRTAGAARLLPVLAVLVLVVATIGVHGAVATTDASWQHALYCLTAPTPCWVTADSGATMSFSPGNGAGDNGDNGNSLATPTDTASVGPTPSPIPSFDPSALPSFTTTGGPWSWNPNGQLNLLLAGIGVQSDPSQLGPDTIMVLHVDRSTGRAALISIGRNNVCVPLPQGVAQSFATGQNGCPAYTWPWMINAFPNWVLSNCHNSPLYADTCGQSADPNRYLRAYKTFEQVVGGFLGLTIDGSMWVNPAGLTRLIDDVGGVDINVPAQVIDKPCGPPGTWQNKFAYCAYAHNGYSVPTGVTGVTRMRADAANSNGMLSISWSQGQDIAMTIKAGSVHMDGDWALAYARTRVFETGGDFDRQSRQQAVLKALRSQLDPCTFASPQNMVSMLGTLKDIPFAFNTDLPVTNPDDLRAWASLAKGIAGGDVQSIVLDPTSTGESLVTIQGITYPAVTPASWSTTRKMVAASLNRAPSSPSTGTGSSTGC